MSDIKHHDMVTALVKAPALIMAELTTYKVDLIHAVLGICGETGELLEALHRPAPQIDRVNVVEELGDIEFYNEQLRQRLGWTREIVFGGTAIIAPDALPGHGAAAAIAGAAILDAVKKATIYDKALDEDELRKQLLNLEEALDAIRLSLGITREETLEANIAKLSKRYEGLKYSNDAAHARADKVEA